MLLLVEVSDSSTEYDREVTVPLYARYSIAEVWLIGLETETVDVYRSPSAQRYQSVSQLTCGQGLSPESFPGLELTVDDILG